MYRVTATFGLQDRDTLRTQVINATTWVHFRVLQEVGRASSGECHVSSAASADLAPNPVPGPTALQIQKTKDSLVWVNRKLTKLAQDKQIK